MRVVVVSEHSTLSLALSVQMPGCDVVIARDTDDVADRMEPGTVVLLDLADGGAGLRAAQDLRSAGLEGGLVVLGADTPADLSQVIGLRRPFALDELAEAFEAVARMPATMGTRGPRSLVRREDRYGGQSDDRAEDGDPAGDEIIDLTQEARVESAVSPAPPPSDMESGEPLFALRPPLPPPPPPPPPASAPGPQVAPRPEVSPELGVVVRPATTDVAATGSAPAVGDARASVRAAEGGASPRGPEGLLARLLSSVHPAKAERPDGDSKYSTRGSLASTVADARRAGQLLEEVLATIPPLLADPRACGELVLDELEEGLGYHRAGVALRHTDGRFDIVASRNFTSAQASTRIDPDHPFLRRLLAANGALLVAAVDGVPGLLAGVPGSASGSLAGFLLDTGTGPDALLLLGMGPDPDPGVIGSFERIGAECADFLALAGILRRLSRWDVMPETGRHLR